MAGVRCRKGHMDCPKITKEELSSLFARIGMAPIEEEETLSNLYDWDINYPNQERILEFVQLYRSGTLSEAQKYELGRLLLASLDDAFEQKGEEECARETEAIEKILKEEPLLHECSLRYWANFEKPEDQFEITLRIRTLLAMLEGSGKL